MMVFALSFATKCEADGCAETATGLFGDLCLCRRHIAEYQKKPMSAEDREMWRKINNERRGFSPEDFE